ncbi:winged helix-turn-helix domain-containing protein [Rubrivirga sp.]|uniref:winged helix-turn-helix domain-containing protein n=1 Tax=Rubrivirga sp. TaxID=1885344 RepID=UPI003B52A73C
MAEEDLTYRFGDFRLDVPNRQLWRGDDRVDLNARYFDALVLLVREHGQLVEKDRFFAEVWGDVVVSDSALTQCVKEIRQRLGDDASDPRYVETVPRYGYRFVGPVEPVSLSGHGGAAWQAASPAGSVAPATGGPPLREAERFPLRTAALWGSAGALGGGFAGVLGGLLYGSALAYAPDARLGTASVLVVLLSLNVLVGLLGGAGVSFGMAAVGWVSRRPLRWSIAGGALGGLVVGGGAKLLGVDAFNLLFGRAPAGITGGLEGAALGAALALGARLGAGSDAASRWRPVAGAGLAGAVAGALIPTVGGHLMGGSLDLLARSFAGSRLQLDALGRLFGEVHFGHTTQVVLGGVEGFLFGSCVVGALVLARLALPASARREQG